MRIFGVILLSLIISFLLTTLCFWLVTLLLPYLGLTFEFTWLRALVVWVICMIIKTILGK